MSVSYILELTVRYADMAKGCNGEFSLFVFLKEWVASPSVTILSTAHAQVIFACPGLVEAGFVEAYQFYIISKYESLGELIFPELQYNAVNFLP